MPVIKSQNGEVLNPLAEEATDPILLSYLGDRNTEFWALDTITYGSLVNDITSNDIGFYTNDDGNIFNPFAFSESHVAQAGDIFSKIARYIDLSFEPSEGDDVPLINFTLSSFPFGGGSASFPQYEISIVDGVEYGLGGNVQLFYDEVGAEPEFDNAYYKVLMHEIGHALGLDHPLDGIGTNELVQRLPTGVSGTDFTVMSLGYVTQFSSRFDGYFLDHEADNWLLSDIIALQAIYGVDQTVTIGDDTYTFSEGTSYYEVIWDTSGIDQIVIDGNSAANIDLSKEGWIDVGSTVKYTNSNDSSDFIMVQDTVYLMADVVIEKLIGGGGSDAFKGNTANNTLIGNVGNDTLDGGGGDDTLEGSAGADALDGGEGADTASYEGSASAVTVNLNTGVFARGDAAGDTLTSIENLTGSVFADRLVGDAVANLLRGGAGGDTLSGGGGADTVEGGTGNDAIFAGSGDNAGDLFAGGAGNDLIAAGAGDDLAIGDSAVASGLTDTTTGADGSDTLFGGSGNDTLIGGGWDDANNNNRYDDGEQQQSGSSSNVAYSGSGNDVLHGDGGADTLGGGLGNDTLTGGGGDDVFYGGKGATDADDVFSGGAGDDIFFGGSGSDIIDGDAGADEIFGGSGDDTLNGGAGADSLFGGGGDDLLTGGSGADFFFFANTHGDDVVTDFNATEDTLFLANTVTDFTDLASVQAAASATTVDGTAGLLIDTGGGNSVFLQGIITTDLTASNLSL